MSFEGFEGAVCVPPPREKFPSVFGCQETETQNGCTKLGRVGWVGPLWATDPCFLLPVLNALLIKHRRGLLIGVNQAEFDQSLGGGLVIQRSACPNTAHLPLLGVRCLMPEPPECPQTPSGLPMRPCVGPKLCVEGRSGVPVRGGGGLGIGWGWLVCSC